MNAMNRINSRLIAEKGFTLIELVIVTAIIGVLASIAYPAYTDSVQKARRADAIEGVLKLAGRLEEFYMNNDSYTGTGADVNTLLGDDQSSDGHYTLSIDDQTNFVYTIWATPNGTDAECDVLIYDSLGQRSDSAGNGNCW